ncbi:MAG TPA: MlaD family protein [Opitutaceae bacterium]|jgi:paraquat-inducible protein B
MKRPPPASEEFAVFKPSHWPGLIWAVPVAALGIVLWLGLSSWLNRGPTVTVNFPLVAGLQASNTKVKFRGYVVGEVDKISFTPGLDHMLVELQFNSEMKGHLAEGTRYWIDGASPSLSDLTSLMSAVSGPTIGIEPHAGPLAKLAVGLPSKNWPGPEAVVYETLLPGTSQGLEVGAPVKLNGTAVGCVTAVRTEADAAKGDFHTRVWFGLEPQELGVAHTTEKPAEAEWPMNRLVDVLVRKGLRAQLGQSIPAIGSPLLELRMVPTAPPAHLMAGSPPKIPASPDVGGLADQIPDLMAQMKQTVAQFGDALKQAQTVLNASAAGNAALGTTDLPHTLDEVSRAAQSLRELTDYLGSHPNAVITGRKNP